MDSDGDLLKGMKAGDEACFLALYRRHQAAVYRFALHMTGSLALAEEVTQEVFMTLIRAQGRYDPNRGSLRSFLFGVSRNCVLRTLERERKPVFSMDELDLESMAPADTTDLAGELESNDIVERVRKAVQTLPAAYRDTVVLCGLNEMTYEEAASVLGCAVGTVRSRLHRARALLAVKLRPLLELDPRPAGQS